MGNRTCFIFWLAATLLCEYICADRSVLNSMAGRSALYSTQVMPQSGSVCMEKGGRRTDGPDSMAHRTGWHCTATHTEAKISNCLPVLGCMLLPEHRRATTWHLREGAGTLLQVCGLHSTPLAPAAEAGPSPLRARDPKDLWCSFQAHR